MWNDSTVYPFPNKSYMLTLHASDSQIYDEDTKNAQFVFTKQGKIVFKDSLSCMFTDIRFEDFNNDGIKDVLVFHYTGARANPTYYLYLVINKSHNLIRVKGFENLPNPSLDTKLNIITSVGLSGDNYYSFYRIGSNNKLVNLGHSYKENPRDSMQYNKAVRSILKEKN